MNRVRHTGRRCAKAFVSVVCFAVVTGAATYARAELVYFSNGRSLSVKGHRTDEGALVLVLRSGGEIICEPAAIARIEPDEVPYPEPPVEGTLAAVPAEAGVPTRLQPELEAYLQKVSTEQDVPAGLVRAVIQVESAYHANARSPKGAVGLMQLMPGTARQYAVANPYDPRANIEAGVKHLKSLLQRFPLTLALAAYNAGEAAVQRFGGIPPYRETQDYVARIVKLFGRATL